jgi:hypothetical protein
VVVLLLFVLCCLLSSARLVLDTIHSAHAADDVAQRSDQRFAALKSALPPRGVIGYIGESGTAGAADYYLAQYALAPLVIENSQNQMLVLGNFPNSQPAKFPPHLQLMRDFGHGVLLLNNLPYDKDTK